MSLTYSAAVEQTITAGEQIHQIVNGTATTEVTVEDGSKVPSVRKALLDNFYFKDPIAWQVGQTENVFNQLRKFTDGSWWYAPSATASNPVSMGSTPVGDSLWKIYDFDAIGKLEPRIDEALRRSYAEAGYNLVAGSFEAGGTVSAATDVLLYGSQGKAYAWGGTFPKVVPPSSSPASTGGVGAGAWVDRTDVTLRGEVDGIATARALNVNVDSIIYSTDTVTVLDNVLYIYDTTAQTTWAKPSSVGAGETIVSIVGSTLTTNVTTYTLVKTKTENTTVDARVFGVVADGVNDDTAAVQAAFAALREKSNGVDSLYFPAGTIRITSTVNVDEIAGGRAFGAGQGRDYSLANSASNSSRFKWDGDTTSPMFLLNGVTNTSFERLSFIGKSSTKSDTHALIELRESTYGIPTGFIDFFGTTFKDAEIGVQAGTLFDDTNCADVNFYFTSMNNLTDGLRVNTQQGLNYLFNFVNAGNCVNVFNLERGGSLAASMVVGSGTENVLTLGRGGPNVGVCELNTVRIEKGARITDTAPKIINCPDSAGAYTSDFIVNVSGVNTEVRTWTGYHNELHNGVKVNFNGVRAQVNFINASSTGTRKTSATVYGSIFNENNPAIAAYITVDAYSSVLVANDNKSLTGSEVTNDYRHGITSKGITLATDLVWVDVFNITLPGGSSSLGIIADISAVQILQGAGTRACHLKAALMRLSGNPFVEYITPLVTIPSASSSKIELQAVGGGSGNIKIQARRVNGSSSTIKVSMSIAKSEINDSSIVITMV